MKKDKLTIVKKNDLIENFVFNASVLELQLLNYAVAMTNSYEYQGDIIYKIEVNDLEKIYGTNSKNGYSYYKDALRRLHERTFSYINDDGNIVTEHVLKKRIHNDQSEHLSFVFSDYIGSRIQLIKDNFTSYGIEQISKFNSKYSFLLYELLLMKLKRTKGLSHKTEINISMLRNKMELNDKYPRFIDFNKKVITPAVDDINKHSDLSVDFIINRLGRKPVSLNFDVAFRSVNTKTINVPSDEDIDLSNALQDLTIIGFSEKQARDLIEQYTAQNCIIASQLAFNSHKKSTIEKSVTGYVIGILNKMDINSA